MNKLILLKVKCNDFALGCFRILKRMIQKMREKEGES